MKKIRVADMPKKRISPKEVAAALGATLWEKAYDDSKNGGPAVYRYGVGLTHIEVHFNLHIGSRKIPNWFCSDYTGHCYLDGTNRKGYKALEEAQKAGQKVAARMAKKFLKLGL